VDTPKPKLERTLGIAVLILLLGGCLLVVSPFVSALLWAVGAQLFALAAASKAGQFVRRRRTLASLVMACALIAVVLVPFVTVGLTLADNVQELKAATERWIENGPRQSTSWLAKVPVVGERAVEQWKVLAADSAALPAKAKPVIESVSLWLLKSGLRLGEASSTGAQQPDLRSQRLTDSITGLAFCSQGGTVSRQNLPLLDSPLATRALSPATKVDCADRSRSTVRWRP